MKSDCEEASQFVLAWNAPITLHWDIKLQKNTNTKTQIQKYKYANTRTHSGHMQDCQIKARPPTIGRHWYCCPSYCYSPIAIFSRNRTMILVPDGKNIENMFRLLFCFFFVTFSSKRRCARKSLCHMTMFHWVVALVWIFRCDNIS